MDENKKNSNLNGDVQGELNGMAEEKTVILSGEDGNENVEDRAEKILKGLKNSPIPDAVQDWDGVLPENESELEIIEDEVHIIDEIKDEVVLEEIPEEERCVLCGKRRRCTSIAEDYEYCAECRIKMLKRPLNGMGIITFVLVFAVFIGVTVLGILPNAGFLANVAVGGQTLLSYAVEQNNELESAVELYDEALVYSESFNLGTPQELVKRAALITEKNDGPVKANAIITSTIGSELAKDDKDLARIMKASEDFTNTQTACANAISPYYNQMTGEMQVDEAIKAVDELIKNNKENYDVDTMIAFKAVVAVFDYNTELEIKFLEEVRKNSPEKYWLYNDGNTLIDAYMRTGEYEKAMKVADGILKYNKTDVDANWAKAHYALINGKKDEAQKIAEKLEGSSATKPTAISIKALIARLDGDYKKAIELCTEAIDGDNYDAETYCQSIVAMILNNDNATAYSMINEYGSYVQNYGTQSDYTKFIYLYILTAYLEDKETYEMIEADFKSEGATLDFPKEFEKYKAKEMSLEEIFMKGDFELR